MARKDAKGYNLYTGEYQRKDGRYAYSYTDRMGERHTIYKKSLVELREAEKKLGIEDTSEYYEESTGTE